jgi:uncharacterized membrane protein
MRATVIKSYLTLVVSLVVLDGLWIFGFMRGLYEREIGALLKSEPSWIAVLVFYTGYAFGIYYLAVAPALKQRAMRVAVVNGAVLGGIAYGVFAITNYSVIQGWSLALVVADVGWGIVVTALTALCGYLAAR